MNEPTAVKASDVIREIITDVRLEAEDCKKSDPLFEPLNRTLYYLGVILGYAEADEFREAEAAEKRT
jgi:hypothetical protein